MTCYHSDLRVHKIGTENQDTFPFSCLSTHMGPHFFVFYKVLWKFPFLLL
jgi:predicted nucleic acid binding AN1-type Zn finger protein